MSLRPELSVLTADAVELLVSAYADPMGVILQSRSCIGLSLESNGRQFAEKGDRRSEARWRAALRVLEDLDLVENLRDTRTGFELTLGGYRVARLLHRGAWPPER